jgi:hypothetical protein
MLSDLEWKAVETVARWLQLFRSATSFMSSSKLTTLSSVYSVFTTLQAHLRHELRGFDHTLPEELKLGLQGALQLLSEYLSLTDASPYYLWSSCKLRCFAEGAY